MQLSFNLEDILYLKISAVDDKSDDIKLAIKEKTENDIIAIIQSSENINFSANETVVLDIVCHDGLYKTKTKIKDIIPDGEYTKFILDNPKSLDYQQNREYYRIMVDYDCIYTVELENGSESFNAVTYDISASGVSIIIDDNIVSKEEMSILFFTPDRNIKSHLRFVRCEIYEEDKYKLSFEFLDMAEKDTEYLSKICTYRQLK